MKFTICLVMKAGLILSWGISRGRGGIFRSRKMMVDYTFLLEYTNRQKGNKFFSETFFREHISFVLMTP